MRRMTHNRLADQPGAPANERGAILIMSVVLIGVIFGFAALVVDLSALYQERRELQNGADAAALAVARNCALGNCGDTYGLADQYADANASDGNSTIPAGGITYPTASSVRVRAVTADSQGDPAGVDFIFARIWGNSSSQVSAEAEVSWQVVGAASTIPLIISVCEWNIGTSGGTVFAQAPYNPALRQTIIFHDGTGPNGPPDCAAQAGQDKDGDGRLPGGFGWLDQNDCVAQITANLVVKAKPGVSVPSGCSTADWLNKEILIPIFVEVSPTEPSCPINRKCYRIWGFAGFFIDGYRFPGNHSNSPCNPPKTCIGGYFTRYVGPDEGLSGNPSTPNLGASTIKLIG